MDARTIFVNRVIVNNSVVKAVVNKQITKNNIEDTVNVYIQIETDIIQRVMFFLECFSNEIGMEIRNSCMTTYIIMEPG